MELPDFKIPHAEKIDWMIEASGWALEAVSPRTDTDPPVAGYAYTIGFPERYGFPEVAVFGLTPVAAHGIVNLVADALAGGTEIPLRVELVGLLDNELRCVFVPVDLDVWGEMFSVGRAWHRGEFDLVQLLWPDKRGLLPYEEGFDPRLVYAQPVLTPLG